MAIKIFWGRSINFNILYYKKTDIKCSIITDGPNCHPWKETFIFFPRRSINGSMLFLTKAYERRVWISWDLLFHSEPMIQYATAFDLLTHDHI